jgi:hypothetical protein
MPGEPGIGRALTGIGESIENNAIAKDYASLNGTTADEALRMINAVGAQNVNDYAKVQLVMALMRQQEEALRARHRR